MRNLHPVEEQEGERRLSTRGERERESHANRCQITHIFFAFLWLCSFCYCYYRGEHGEGEAAGEGEADIVATLPPAIRRFDTPRFDIDTSG